MSCQGPWCIPIVGVLYFLREGVYLEKETRSFVKGPQDGSFGEDTEEPAFIQHHDKGFG